MGFIRPATPGFVVTLIATILLAVVSFCVPYFKSVYFLRADISINNNNGSITFGTLGYCLELSNGTTCSSPSIGYQLDINSLVGNRFSVQIPQVAVKWLTYALFLHVVALALSAGSAIFGLLAHVREMSMTCCSTCVSGFAAAITLIAFIFDIALFFIAKARINAVGRASMGNAVWLTLAAWLLLFFSGCFFMLGRCCITKRGPRSKWGKREDQEIGGPDNRYAEQMRLDAVKAEADRKARQKAGEGGLPAFSETQPLTGRVDGDSVYTDSPYKESETSFGSTPSAVHNTRPQATGYPTGGYTPAPPGSRAVDEYYNPTPTTTYPPRPQAQTHSERQGSTYSHSPSTYAQNSSAVASSPRRQGSGYAPTTASPPLPNNQYLTPSTYGQDSYGAQGRDYGHTAGGSSYHTATSHQQQPTAYSHYDQYNHAPQSQPQHYSEPSFNAETYNNTSILNSPSPPMPAAGPSAPNPYTHSTQTPPVQGYAPPERNYTLGGDGYGVNSVPPLPEHSNSSYYPYPGQASSYPAPLDTNTSYAVPAQTSPVKSSRLPPLTGYPADDAPPGYEVGTSGVTGQWGKH